MKIECYKTMQDGVQIYVIREAHEGPGRSKQLSFYIDDKGNFVRCRVRNLASSPKPERSSARKAGANAAAGSKSKARRNMTTSSRRPLAARQNLTTAKSSTRSATAAKRQAKMSPKSRGRNASKKSA